MLCSLYRLLREVAICVCMSIGFWESFVVVVVVVSIGSSVVVKVLGVVLDSVSAAQAELFYNWQIDGNYEYELETLVSNGNPQMG